MRSPFDVLRERLSVYLGPNTTRTALKTFAQRTMGGAAETLSVAQAKDLLLALRPTLKALLGAAQCDRILAQLDLELTLRT